LAPLEVIFQVQQVENLPMRSQILSTGTAKHRLNNTGILCSAVYLFNVESNHL
jgi:hypothetical protein